MSGSLFHIRYTAYILNLIVKNSLLVIRSTIVKIHESISYWRTIKRKKFFYEITRKLNISCARKLVLDCAIR